MADQDRLLDVIVATYDNLNDAERDAQSVEAFYKSLSGPQNFDAVIVRKTEKGKVRIERKYDAGTRHASLEGVGWGLAAGLVASLFPPVGIAAALTVGGAGGTAIGAIVGHVQSSISRSDLKKIGDELDNSTAALIVVYETSLAEQVARNIKARKHVVAKLKDLAVDDLAERMRESQSA